MMMIGEDEVGLKEMPEDIRYMKEITSKRDPKHWEGPKKNTTYHETVISFI